MDSLYNGPKMEARATSGASSLVLDIETRLTEDPFFYGYRWVGDAGKLVARGVSPRA